MDSLAHHRGWIDAWRRHRWGVAASFIVHVAVVVALANLVRFDQSRELGFAITSVWREPLVHEELELSPLSDVPLIFDPQAQAGGTESAEAAADWQDTTRLAALLVEPAFFGPATTASISGAKPPRAAKIAKAPTSRGNRHGAGNGLGTQPGFFGMTPPDASRVIFVVDGSRSMNHPHDSELKTRFRRVKFELLKCITEMQPTQSFYVIFFSNEVLPMPATALQPAQPGYREPYLQWIGSVQSGGSPTDPRDALALALRMQPDVICFLTDGEFPKGVSRQLMSIRQDRTVIHTFAFGDTLGEETLKTMAQNNRGEYRFVP